MVTWVTPLLSPVLAAHEPDCLRKAVGQRRQLGSAMRQTFDGLQLLGGSGGAGFGFLRRGVGPRLGLLERLIDSGRPLPDAMRQLRDLFPGAGRAPRRLCNAGQALYPVARAAHDVREIAADALEQLCGAVERPARFLCGLPDVARLSTACFGELVDLICHYREAPPVNPGARRFDRGVEGEQVGLVGDEADGFRELLDLLRHVAQPPYLAGALFGRETQIGQATDGGLGGEADLLRGLLHLRARVASLGARGGHLRGVVGQLFRVAGQRAEEHTSELQSQSNLVCRLLLEKKKRDTANPFTPPRLAPSEAPYAGCALSNKQNARPNIPYQLARPKEAHAGPAGGTCTTP